MASTSSSSPPRKHEVFISFRGHDIRYGFFSHLCDALQRKQINVFSGEDLHKGEEISPSLLKLIEESYVSIVIFSENYAYSSWSLDELVMILECHEKLGQLVLPVFYKVDPTEVHHLTGNFGKALARHEDQGSLQKVDEWKRALLEVSNLSGWYSQNFKYESILVEEIVNDVLKKVSYKLESDDSYDRNLIGIESRVEKVEQLLNNKQVVGIWGMGGIGKTTIAQEVFRRHRNKFDGYCFVENVRETMTKQSLTSVRDKIICELLRDKSLQTDALYLDGFTRRRLRSMKVFIVFDDVDDFHHLKNLAAEHDLYGEGSRIIVTSRDRLVLEYVCSKGGIYEVENLIHSQGLELFSLYAFKQNHPREGYMELSKMVTIFAEGNPLALKVLGSYLFATGIEEWKSTLDKLKGKSLMRIQDVLKTSYDNLELNEKEIFLHIACFFKGENIDCVERILEACAFFPKTAIRRLIDQSLIKISDGNVVMDSLLEQMGKDIVNKECKRPGERSRLWNYEDIHHVLTKDMGTKYVEGILLDMYKNDNLVLSSTAFVNMYNLRFLKVSNIFGGYQVLLPNGLQFLPQELRYLYWSNYPLESLPLDFCPKNLVELHMPFSTLKQLWNRDKPLENLKLMDLRGSKYMTRIPALSSFAPRLEFLYLTGCLSLVEIPSLQNLRKLTELNLGGCHRVTNCPEIPCNIRILTLDGTAIEQLPSSFEHLSQLVKLSLNDCTKLVSLPSSIGKLKRLEELSLYDCSRLESIPISIVKLKSLRLHTNKNMSGNKEQPHQHQDDEKGEPPLERLKHIEEDEDQNASFHFSIGHDEKEIINLSRNIESESEDDAKDELMLPKEASALFLIHGGMGLTKPPKVEQWEGLIEICLMDNEISELPISPSCPNLRKLFLERNYNLRIIPPSFFDSMPALQVLNLSRTSIKSLPESLFKLFNLRRLFLNHCVLITTLSSKVGELKQLEVLDLEGTEIMYLPKEVGQLTNLTCLEVSFFEPTSQRRLEQSGEIIPCGAISALSQLEELNIDMSYDDKRWNASAEAVVSEICRLESLHTLKVYFPKVELLSHLDWNEENMAFPSLSYFKFTVGHLVERIISRVLGDTELELERHDRYLKYVNGEGVPGDIKKVLRHSTAFFLDRNSTISRLSDFGYRNMQQLKCLVAGQCNELQAIIGGDQIESSSSDATVGLVSLEYMHIYYMKNLRSIWEGPVNDSSFNSLKYLTLRTCPELTTVFTPRLLANFSNLEELTIRDCPKITTLVSCYSCDDNITFILPALKRISLHFLPKLTSISSGLLMAPMLELMSFQYCLNLKSLPVSKASNKNLRKIKGEASWWQELKWEGTHHDSWADIFVPID